MCGMPGCVSEIDAKHKVASEEYGRKTKELKEKYSQELNSDPNLASIRGKPGISFDGCPTDHFDNTYPTQEQREAIKKYHNLLEVYGNEELQAQLMLIGGRNPMFYAGMLQRSEAQLKQHLASIRALHAGRLTWAQFGAVCEQIDTGRRNTEFGVQQQQWDNFNQQQEQIRKEQQVERRHQEAIEAIRQSGKQQQNSPSPSSTTCYPGPGGQVTCHHN